MRILLLAPTYLNLYCPIKKELERQGHEVFFVEDHQLRTDSRLLISPFYSRCIYHVWNLLTDTYGRYWRKVFRKKTEFKTPFDLLFCIQGLSFDPVLLTLLRQVNPNIHSSLYIWDSNCYYDFFQNIDCFDRVFTFDYQDAQKSKGQALFLPFYWTQSDSSSNTEYDFSLIGKDHDGRFEIVSKIAPQIKSKGYSCFIKLLPANRYGGLGKIAKIRFSIFHPVQKRKMIEEYEACRTSSFAMSEVMPVEQVEKIIGKTKVIIDTDRITQTGTTPRVIWALANGKKIISTNQNLRKMPFFDERQIQIIDRDDPKIDFNFINAPFSPLENEMLGNLRIDRWVRNFVVF